MTRYRIKDWKFVVFFHLVFIASFGVHHLRGEPATPTWVWVALPFWYVLFMATKLERKTS